MQQILYDAEKNLVDLLLYEASQFVAKIQIDLDAEIRKINSTNYDQNYMGTKQKYYKYRKKLEAKRSKKWKNVREKLESNSKQNASSNAPNVDKNNMLLNVAHKNHSDCCYVRENLKDSPDCFLGTKMVSQANADSNETKNENTKTESAIDEMTVVKVNETFIIDNRTARKKKQKAYAQTVTENMEKTTDQNVSCLKKELQMENDEKTIDLTKIKKFCFKMKNSTLLEYKHLLL